MEPNHTGRRAAALTLAGLAFLWPCLESFVTRCFRASLALSAFSLPTEWAGAVVCASVLACTLLTAALYAKRRLPKPRCTRGLVVVLGVLASLGNLAFAQADALGEAVTPIAAAALALVGAFIVAAVLAWGQTLAALPARQALLAVLLSNAASLGVQALLNALGGAVLLYALTACPAATVLCWAAGRPTHAETAWAPLGASLRRLPWRRLGAAFALICFEGVFSPLLFSRHQGWPHGALGMTILICAAICLTLAALVRRMRTVQDALGAALPALLTLYMAALLLAAILPASPAMVAERTMVAVGTALRIYLWLLLSYECCANGAPSVAAFLVYCLLALSVPHSAVSSLLQEQFGRVAASGGSWGPGVLTSLAAVALFAVAVLGMAVSSKNGRGGAEEPRADAVVTLAREAGLSQRETQVLSLLARGFSAKAAAQRLGLAQSTVVTHTTHIYRKLRIGSRQELLQLVDACSPSAHDPADPLAQ